MKPSAWKKHHKYFGIVLAFFLTFFCLSGIVLNHPSLFSEVDVSRSLLPESYQYKQWNRGLLRGTVNWKGAVLIYGTNGVWKTDREGRSYRSFNRGLPKGSDYQNFRRIAVSHSGILLGGTTDAVYQLGDDNTWHTLPLNTNGERISDLTLLGDSLIVTGRSNVYVSLPPYRFFTSHTLRAPHGYDGKVSLFRTIWMLHSGELLGLIGRLAVDMIGIVFLILTLTGMIYWLIPLQKRLTLNRIHGRRFRAQLYKWHNHIGRTTLMFTLLLAITGWMLRPPALIAIASGRIPPLPFSKMDSDNPWHDKLRALRYDAGKHDWLLYTADGFYSLRSLTAQPRPERVQPPVSVMGINVAETDNEGDWLIGSFNGLYAWNRKSGQILDFFTLRTPEAQTGIPFSPHAISGFSSDFSGSDIIVDYNEGAAYPRMPEWMQTLPMSLRAVCLEIHTGRIYTFLGKWGTTFYIFIIGLAIFWCLWTGWRVLPRRRKLPPHTPI